LRSKSSGRVGVEGRQKQTKTKGIGDDAAAVAEEGARARRKEMKRENERKESARIARFTSAVLV